MTEIVKPYLIGRFASMDANEIKSVVCLSKDHEDKLKTIIDKLFMAQKARTSTSFNQEDYLRFLKMATTNFLIDQRLFSELSLKDSQDCLHETFRCANNLKKCIEFLLSDPVTRSLVSSKINREDLRCSGKPPEEMATVLAEFTGDILKFISASKGKPGHPFGDGTAKRIFIRNLGTLYQEIAQKTPYKSNNVFLNFVNDCLGVLKMSKSLNTIATHIRIIKKDCGGFPEFKEVFNPKWKTLAEIDEIRKRLSDTE